MQQKHKPQLDCGVDGINIIFSSIYETEQDVYHFVRNECNKKIEYATLKKAKATNEQIEYALYVNLPKMLRNTNIQPYSVLDCTKYAGVYQFLFDQLTQLFGMNIPELIVTGIECSFSYTLADKELLKPMLNYITRAFISKNNGMHVYVKGVQSKRYEKCEVYCDSLQVQSFRTSRASDCLGSFKCYNKLQEQLDHETNSEVREEIIHQMKEKSVLRFEWILNSRGVTRILGQNTVLWSVLSANSISNRAMDENVRLKANVWIAEKLVGKSYSIADVEGNIQDNDINIFLNVRNATTNDSESDSESWNDDTSELDNWGEDDIYK